MEENISIVVIWFGSDVETNEFLPIVSIYINFRWHFARVRKKSSHDDGRKEHPCQNTPECFLFITLDICTYAVALALVLPIPDAMWNTDIRRSSPYSLWALSFWELFWCAFRLHNQSRNMRHFYTAQCKTLVNTENVQIKPITLFITKRFAFLLLFGTTFIRTAMYSVWCSSHTVTNLQRMLLAFCISPLFDHHANKLRVQSSVQTAPANNGLRLLWCVCVRMATSHSCVKLTCQPNLFDVELCEISMRRTYNERQRAFVETTTLFQQPYDFHSPITIDDELFKKCVIKAHSTKWKPHPTTPEENTTF